MLHGVPWDQKMTNFILADIAKDMANKRLSMGSVSLESCIQTEASHLKPFSLLINSFQWTDMSVNCLLMISGKDTPVVKG